MKLNKDFTKKIQEQKLKIKRIKTEVEILIIKRKTLKF
jgi:hypothetical protein